MDQIFGALDAEERLCCERLLEDNPVWCDLTANGTDLVHPGEDSRPTVAGEEDPFTRCFHRLRQLPNPRPYWLPLAQRYAYVFSSEHLLDVVRRYAPLVEIGAGTGYWAYRLRQLSADIVAYDLAPPGGPRNNRYHPDVRSWTGVSVGDATVLAGHRGRALFVCWPPAYSSLWDALRFYMGDVVIYLGDHGPRTARLAGLEEGFERIEFHAAYALDPAPGRPAQLSVWRRRTAATGDHAAAEVNDIRPIG